MRNQNRGRTFLEQHAIQYGVKVCEINSETKKVQAVQCQFCVYFGQDFSSIILEERKRQPTTRTKVWTLFRSDSFRCHHEKVHNEDWKRYQALGYKERKEYFQKCVPLGNTIPFHFQENATVTLKIQCPIVDIIIGEMMFHPDEQGDVSHVRTLKLFELSTEETGGGMYMVTISNPRVFSLVVKNMMAGLSFAQVWILPSLSDC
jgi:hypothetical protein